MFYLKVKQSFFDKDPVIRALDRADRSILSRIGAFIRTRARSSMRRRKKSAAAGQPPSVHVGDLRQRLYFGYDVATRSVVVGPVKFGSGDVPNLMEFGGTVTRRGRALHYLPHAYMGPALRAETAAGTIPPQWRNSVKG
jgi:hypothetical protein